MLDYTVNYVSVWFIVILIAGVRRYRRLVVQRDVYAILCTQVADFDIIAHNKEILHYNKR